MVGRCFTRGDEERTPSESSTPKRQTVKAFALINRKAQQTALTDPKHYISGSGRRLKSYTLCNKIRIGVLVVYKKRQAKSDLDAGYFGTQGTTEAPSQVSYNTVSWIMAKTTRQKWRRQCDRNGESAVGLRDMLWTAVLGKVYLILGASSLNTICNPDFSGGSLQHIPCWVGTWLITMHQIIVDIYVF